MKKDDRERVIFRIEYDPYMNKNKYLAIFPDDVANYGRCVVVPLYQNGYSDAWWRENATEADWSYIYSKKIVHKNDSIIPELVEALKKFYGGEYRVMEKVM